MSPRRVPQRGFTLVEAVIVIVITGIIAAVVAVFIRAPVQGYVDSARRAEMTNTADTVARRIARDLRLALPNSVRIFGGSPGTSIEFLQTRSGGRYRTAADPSAGTPDNDPLDFTQNDTSFSVLGPPITFQSGDQIVVYNLGIPGADAYEGSNRRAYGSVAGNTVTISSTSPFPFDSPAHRFQVVDTPVTYRCAGGELRRHSGYPIAAVQVAQPATGIAPLLAKNISCSFGYAVGISERSGLVTLRVTISHGGETVSLYHEVHVGNVP